LLHYFELILNALPYKEALDKLFNYQHQHDIKIFESYFLQKRLKLTQKIKNSKSISDIETRIIYLIVRTMSPSKCVETGYECILTDYIASLER